MGGDQNLLGPVGLQDADQLVALVQGQGRMPLARIFFRLTTAKAHMGT